LTKQATSSEALQAEADRLDTANPTPDRESPNALDDLDLDDSPDPAADAPYAEEQDPGLDLMQLEEEKVASKIDMTEVADLHSRPKEEVVIRSPEEMDDGGCGLPPGLMNRKSLTAYELQYGLTAQDRRTIEYTAKERDLWERYQKQAEGPVTKDHFVAALRLHKHGGFPVEPRESIKLNQMKVS
jgi:hypothetical protein